MGDRLLKLTNFWPCTHHGSGVFVSLTAWEKFGGGRKYKYNLA
ncbi:hypothetical protein D082_07490 [Synechocystis sp. PCC 6714]|nr:hypothetical protein D082_07490 [Synechocystis sp. PCC 6714]